MTDEFAPARAARATKLRRLALVGLALLALVFAFPVRGAAPAEVFIDGPIDSDTVTEVELALTAAKESGQDNIRVRIDSPGGSVFAGLRIVRLIEDSGLQTSCEVEGLAASMAAAILESPACDVRVVRPWSIVMFHEAAGANGQKQGDVESDAAALRAVNRAMAAMVAPRLGLSIDAYLALTLGGREVWVAGVDAIERHVADAVR